MHTDSRTKFAAIFRGLCEPARFGALESALHRQPDARAVFNLLTQR